MQQLKKTVMKIEIKNVKGEVIFSHECEENTATKTVEAALKLSINLNGANLRYANLSGADLSGANLSDANLRHADLSYANLRHADLGYANLSDANLSGANLDNVVFNERTSFFSMQCPEEGSFIGWKVASQKIVKLLITEDSKRSSATSLKCRCSKAKVLDIQEADGSPSNVNEVRSDYDDSFIYKIGEVIKVDDFDENRWNECSTGIHFFVSRDMAVVYY